ncbi:hypothetical protein NGM10_17555 (plasmid) [Halorussus salilacus]|uniref:methionine adenosyltransferase n=1 Tax=Halorussus salilacus TaxID=2953750 RepID=UPI00209FE642|nr:methionine adenosyltransferase [Halorussus salilacus]USZ70008.1 hypothetical protein NGM10_17555 [Halorussus salilacus]
MKLYSDLKTPDDWELEVVERKGIGHPDTLADGLAETVSNEYAAFCEENFDAVLHHNIDKLSLIGGLAEVDFGEGDEIVPSKVILNGRMSTRFGDEEIDIETLMRDSVKRYLNDILPNLDTSPKIEIHTNDYSHNPHWYRPRDLQDVPDAESPHANDTSTCVSYWPPTPVEEAVLGIEAFFYDDDLHPRFDYVGQDIKVMANRNGSSVDFTVAVPFITEETPDLKFYERHIEDFEERIAMYAEEIMNGKYDATVTINHSGQWEDEYYLLATGSCIESGEEGVVGRGNQAHGTISIHRPSSMEAPHGKNPVYHVGKVYQIISDHLSRTIAGTFDCRCTVNMTSKIGADLYDPGNLTVRTDTAIDEGKLEDVVYQTLRSKDWTAKIVDEGALMPLNRIREFKQRSNVSPN